MAGFYTRDDQGRVTFQLTDRIVRFLGAVEITAANTSGVIDIPAGISGAPFCFPCYNGDQAYGENNSALDVSGRRISWQRIAPGTVIKYGVY